MRAKALVGVTLAVMLVLVTVPQAWAAYSYASELESKLFKQYKQEGLIPEDTKQEEALSNLGGKSNYVEKIIAEKYNKGGLDALTADEAYVLLTMWGGLAENGLVEKKSPQEELELWLKLAEKYPQYPPAWEGLSIAAEDAGDIALMFYAYSRYLELVPKGKVPGAPEGQGEGGVWNWFADSLEEYGYPAAAEFPRKVYEQRLYEQLHTRDDLRKIGFYEWRDKYIMPMYKARGTFAYKVQSKLALLTALTAGNLPVAVLVLCGIAFVVVVLAFMLIRTGRAVPFIAGVLLLVGVPVYLVLRAPETFAMLLVLFLSHPLVMVVLGTVVFFGAVALLISMIRHRRATASAR